MPVPVFKKHAAQVYIQCAYHFIVNTRAQLLYRNAQVKRDMLCGQKGSLFGIRAKIIPNVHSVGGGKTGNLDNPFRKKAAGIEIVNVRIHNLCGFSKNEGAPFQGRAELLFIIGIPGAVSYTCAKKIMFVKVMGMCSVAVRQLMKIVN